MSSCSESAIVPVAGGRRARRSASGREQGKAATPPHPPPHSRARDSRRWRNSRSGMRTCVAHSLRRRAAICTPRSRPRATGSALWGCCTKRRHPWPPSTLPFTRAPHHRSRAIPATAAPTRT
eukprot:2025886-Prymnesium_polylepis.1